MTAARPAGGSATNEGDLVGQMMAAMRSNDPDVVLELYADDCQVADPARNSWSGEWWRER